MMIDFSSVGSSSCKHGVRVFLATFMRKGESENQQDSLVYQTTAPIAQKVHLKHSRYHDKTRLRKSSHATKCTRRDPNIGKMHLKPLWNRTGENVEMKETVVVRFPSDNSSPHDEVKALLQATSIIAGRHLSCFFL
ncbi:unnamed protein product [Amoebophrya sp. A25]|nr:unnamed protein product [Amoebophrya sp. A25]|eukprot:GSA25T00025310001.1